MDLRHFSLHYKLPFLIFGIDVLNNKDLKVRERCRLLISVPNCSIFPLKIHFSQNLFLNEMNLLCDLQEGRKFLMNKEEFLFTLFHDFPHTKEGLRALPTVITPC